MTVADGVDSRATGELLLTVAVVVAGVGLLVTPAAAAEPVASCELSRTEIQPGEEVVLDASASENAEQYQYDKGTGGGFGDYVPEETRQFTYEEPGTYEPRVRVRSPEDQTDTASCGTLTVVANQPPTAEFSYSPTEPAPEETVTFESSSSDSDGEVVAHEWRVDGETVADGRSFEYAFPAPGEYTVELVVTDDDDATDRTERTVTVGEGNEPPVAELSYSPTEPATGESVSFTSESSDPDGEIASYSWRIDDQLVSRESNFEYTFEEPGDHALELVVTDDDGATDTAKRVVTVTEGNEPPTVSITYSPRRPAPDETVSFEAEATDPDGEVASYAWRVDGDAVGEGPSLAYAFPGPGEYTVAVTVTDDEGATASATRTVTVEAEATPTPTPTVTETPPPTPTPTVTRTPVADAPVVAGWWYSPFDPRPGETVTLVAEGPSLPGLTYQWDVDDDDGFEKRGTLAAHSFRQNRSVTLRVTGPNGETATRSATVVVRRSVSGGDGSDGGGGRDGRPSFWMTPLDPRPGERVTLVAADPAGSNATYRWDLDGDREFERRGRTVNATFGGDRRVRLRRVGPDGRSATASSTLSTRSPPPANATDDGEPSFWMTPLDPRPGERVTLLADPGATPSDEVAAYRWDFDGDGEPDARGPAVSHNFSEGLRSVRLSIERENGTTATVRNAVPVGNATPTPTGRTATATDSTGGFAPGFGPVAALVALALLAVLARRGRR